MCICILTYICNIYLYKYMYVMTINKKEVMNLKEIKERTYGSIWRRKGKGEMM